jgi:hypothetical protein
MPSRTSLCTSTPSSTSQIGDAFELFASQERGEEKIQIISHPKKNRLQLSRHHGRSSEQRNAQRRAQGEQELEAARAGGALDGAHRRARDGVRWTAGWRGARAARRGTQRQARVVLRTARSGKRGVARRDVQRRTRGERKPKVARAGGA